MLAIITFFIAHWLISVFFQSFFLHRYCAHRMYTMSKGWERTIHFLTFLTQGSSFLMPRGYMLLHREHHAYSDTEKDPHSPHIFRNLWTMMNHTKDRYRGIVEGRIESEKRFDGDCPSWPLLDNLSTRWSVRLMFGAAYTIFYFEFAPHWAWFALLPIHYIMGPVHGAIVNWAGHKYGYRNFDTTDKSRNTLWFDFLTAGELFQNNHHRRPASANFAARWFELDPTYQVMKLLHAVGIIRMLPDKTRATLDTADVAPGQLLVREAD